MYKTGNQLYIESENNMLFIYVHLNKLGQTSISRIFNDYIESYRKNDFEVICVSFWNIGIPGEHLSTFRKTNSIAIGKILKGIRYIDAFFHYKDNIKRINKPILIE